MSSPYDSRLKALIEGLIQRSEAPVDRRSLKARLEWEQTGMDVFELSLPRSTIRISSRDGDGQYPFSFTIVDQNGRLVEEVEAGGPQFDDYDISRLYLSASRNFRKVDEKISEIMHELGIEESIQNPDDPWGSASKGNDLPF